MKLQFKLLALVLSFSSLIIAQNEVDSTANSVIDQFETTITKSNNYQDYKVIKKEAIRDLQTQVVNEINRLETEILSHSKTISERDQRITALKSEVDSLQNATESLAKQQDEMLLFGSVSLTKISYRIVMWSTASVLFLLLLFFIFRFRRSYLINAEIKDNLRGLENEFQNYKHNALDKQQKLGRELQDVKNAMQKKKKN